MTLALDVITVVLLGLGSLCVLLAAVGVVRMPDLFTRMQAACKASTLGAILVLLPTAYIFPDRAVWTILVIVFLALTTPIATHTIARAAYLSGTRMADPGALDEFEPNLPEPPSRRGPPSTLYK